MPLLIAPIVPYAVCLVDCNCLTLLPLFCPLPRLPCAVYAVPVTCPFCDCYVTVIYPIGDCLPCLLPIWVTLGFACLGLDSTCVQCLPWLFIVDSYYCNLVYIPDYALLCQLYPFRFLLPYCTLPLSWFCWPNLYRYPLPLYLAATTLPYCLCRVPLPLAFLPFSVVLPLHYLG